MIRKILQFTISNLVIILGLVFLVYNFVPLSWFEFGKTQTFGATITTIQGTDTLSASRTTINTNFTNLNTDISNLMATTSMGGLTSANALTSATSLASIGTITTGVWNGTAITAVYGGTGSTTLASNQILLGNGTGIVKTVAGFGASGYFLQSAGANTPPVWASAGTDVGASYTWTGLHTFNTLGAVFNATSTFNNSFRELGDSYMASTSIDYLNVAQLMATSTTATSTINKVKINVLEVGSGCKNCVGTTIVSGTGAGPTSASEIGTVTVNCPSGMIVVGGGGKDDSEVNEVIYMFASYPGDSDTWITKFRAGLGGAGATTMTGYAVCVNI